LLIRVIIENSQTSLSKQNAAKSEGVATKHVMSCNSANTDLPTPITSKSGGFEKKPRKTWRLGPQTWRL